MFYILYFTHWASHLLRMFLKISTIFFVETENQIWSLSYSSERREKKNMASFESQMWSKWNDDEIEYNDLQGNVVINDYGKEVNNNGEEIICSIHEQIRRKLATQCNS